ncbi:phosphoesterase family protein [Collimonas arenae]|uniref:Phosphoesterase family protein n=1 Tax=Collimonas arenae TaxID=279058 RepID=A0A127PL05_9BURK|nr:alkaline phosphatase family protein [Collimonas arenae]AMO98111.1 phosphoesterase family protein [Collimonas arenae]AMP07978.1 phosphoesterase family protein [Collimonas arenae]
MKLRSLALACATLVYLSGCGGGGGSSIGTAPATVNGVAASGKALVGVTVTITDSSGQNVQTAVTDVNGKFSIPLKGTAPFILTAPFNDADGSAATLSAVINPSAAQSAAGSTVQANLNPLTSLVTQRVLGLVPSGSPSAAQISAAKISSASIAQAVTDVGTPLQPLFTALGVPAAETSDPIGTTAYQANSSDPLDNLFDITRFNVHSGQIAVGTDANRAVLTIPLSGSVSGSLPSAAIQSVMALNNGPTTTPIQNVIVVVGENQTFDAVFGAYQPPQGQTVKNLLSQGIINADGTPGPNFSLALQNQGATQTAYTITPTRSTAYATLPQPTAIGELIPPTFQDPGGVPDSRFPANLPNGPFQITKYVPYGTATTAQTGDPVHRFFQMWQQTGGDNSKLDMFTWVADTVGQGGDTKGITPSNPGQGGELMGFVNMVSGDAPFFKSLAQQYALSDNYHQGIMGGTGANFFNIATGDLPYFNSGGAVAVPPANQIENPNPMAQTANFYSQDGYQGGSYVNCSDATQPGVGAILNFLGSKKVKSNCDAGKYYLVNNYNPGYDMNGNVQPIGPNNYNYPPQTVPTIAEGLAKKSVAWKWYTGGREAADVTADAAAFGFPVAVAQIAQYNAIGDPLVASSNVMTTALKSNLAGLTTFYSDIAKGTLPAVSFVVPKNLDSGHPGYSAPARYEAFLQDLIAKVKANPTLWAHTAILVTTDEGGGHFDTGYIQNLDFFGNGPRIPFLVVSPYARTGFIDHTYYDHSSMLKFIERNWRLPPLSPRSRDNLPNPVSVAADQYRPVNTTSIGDLMAMFNF